MFLSWRWEGFAPNTLSWTTGSCKISSLHNSSHVAPVSRMSRCLVLWALSVSRTLQASGYVFPDPVWGLRTNRVTTVQPSKTTCHLKVYSACSLITVVPHFCQFCHSTAFFRIQHRHSYHCGWIFQGSPFSFSAQTALWQWDSRNHVGYVFSCMPSHSLLSFLWQYKSLFSYLSSWIFRNFHLPFVQPI